jgi:SAM-dependent methyltransferase
VEPGTGALNAVKRGLSRIIQSSLAGARFDSGSLPAVGMFDVLEHIEDETGCLTEIHRVLRPDGRLYLTVPALTFLWSDEDVSAGHFRRYSRPSLRKALENANYRIDEISYFMFWPVLPIFCFRSLPHRLGRLRPTNGNSEPSPAGSPESMEGPPSEHRLPRFLAPCIQPIHELERRRLRHGGSQPFGSSLIAIATKVSSG